MILFLAYAAYVLILLALASAVVAQAMALALNLFALGAIILIGIALFRYLSPRKYARDEDYEHWQKPENW